MSQDEELQLVRTLAQRVAGSFGLELFDVRLRHESTGRTLRVVIDRPAASASIPAETDGPRDPYADSVGIEDCQRVSRDLSVLLDVEGTIDKAYTLEVSSPGLDRPLRTADDYRRFVGRLATIVVAEAIGGQTHLTGHLKGVEDDSVVIERPGGRMTRVPFAGITRARLEVEF